MNVESYFIFKVQYAAIQCLCRGTEQIRLKKEQGEKERKRKDKAEAHLYTVIKVVFP
jgi:hypothetical protein